MKRVEQLAHSGLPASDRARSGRYFLSKTAMNQKPHRTRSERLLAQWCAVFFTQKERIEGAPRSFRRGLRISPRCWRSGGEPQNGVGRNGAAEDSGDEENLSGCLPTLQQSMGLRRILEGKCLVNADLETA